MEINKAGEVDKIVKVKVKVKVKGNTMESLGNEWEYDIVPRHRLELVA